jgi:hypothetical protein
MLCVILFRDVKYLRNMRLTFVWSAILIVTYACKSPNNSVQKAIGLDGFTQWRTGHDPETIQLIPANGNDALAIDHKRIVAHVRFNVKGYGEMSFPIDPATPVGEEARKVNLSGKEFIVIGYKSNQDAFLQLRQTGVHGGTHNHVVIRKSNEFITDTIFFTEFKGGLKPLDLSDVAKFNFAFLSNNPQDGFSDLTVEKFRIGPTIKQ